MTDETPTPDQAWYAGIEDAELRGYVENKGWDNPGLAVQNARELEKLLGVKEQLVKLPDPDDADGWNTVYDRLGRPQTPDEYGLDKLDGSDPEFAKTAAQWMYENGLSKSQAEKIAAQWNGYAAQILEQQNQEAAARAAQEMDALKKEWGTNFEALMAQGRAAVNAFGIAAEDVAAIENTLGTTKMMKLFQSIGAGLGEDKFVKSEERGGGFHPVSPDAARAKIADLTADRGFMEKYMAGDKAAVEKMSMYHKMLNGEG